MQWLDAIDHIVDVYFLQAQEQDVTVGFAEVRSADAARGLGRLPGVMTDRTDAGGAAKLRAGPRWNGKAVQGVPAHQQCTTCTTRRAARSTCRRRDS